MRESVNRKQILAGAIVAVVAAIIAYPAWVINEALLDFMSLPRNTANIGLLLLIYVPLALIGAVVCWKLGNAGADFFWELGIASTFVILVMAVAHQSAVTRKWEQTPQGRHEHETRSVSAAYEKLLQPSALATLKPPLDRLSTGTLTWFATKQCCDLRSRVAIQNCCTRFSKRWGNRNRTAESEPPSA